MNTVTSLAKAYALAAQWHTSQRSKGEAGEPYVNHLVEVAQLVTSATGDAWHAAASSATRLAFSN